MNFTRYSTYVESEVEWVGKLPAHWSTAPLKRAFNIEGGSTPPPDERYWNGGIFWVTPADLSGLKSLFIQVSKRTITYAGLVSCGTALLPEGSIILSTRAPIGSLAITQGMMCTNQGCKGLIPRQIASSWYFAYVLQIAKSELNNRGKGTTFLEISGDELGRFELPIPPLAEQTQIACFLDHETARIDALIAEQQRLIELLKEKRQAVISHAVTKGLDPNVPMKDSGVEWLGEVPEHWRVMPLKYFVRTTKGFAFKSQDYCDEGVRMVRASDIKNKTILESEVFLPLEFAVSHRGVRLSQDDIVISTVGSNPDVVNSAVGQVGMVPPKLHGTLLNQNTVVMRPVGDVDRQYFMQVLSATSYRKYLDLNAHGTANQSSLSLEEILDFKAAIPPLNEQVAIAENVLEMNSLLTKLLGESEKQIGLLRERRSALISAAVTGKIDVRNWQPDQSRAASIGEDYAMVDEPSAEYR